MSPNKKIFLRFVGLAAVLYAGLVLWRVPYFIRKQKTDEAVAKIKATRLTLDDVMGKNLPPDPGREADKTIAGVDANENGIRDDVELAIFKAYPNSAKMRAVLLQYAMALQLEFTQPIVNTAIVIAVAETGDRALNCLWGISSRSDMAQYLEETSKNEGFVKSRQVNNTDRDKYQESFYEHLGSYSSPNDCNLDISGL